MKQCPNCGTVIEDDAKFCLSCGTPVPAEAPVAQAPVEAPVAAETPVEAETPVFIPVEYAAATEQAPAKKPLDKKLIALIAAGAVAVAAIIFVIIGFATNWFGAPLSKVEDAIEKTLDANSLTLEATAEIPSMGEINMEGKLVLDRESETISALADVSMGENYIIFMAADGKMYRITGEGDDKEAEVSDIPADAFAEIFKILNAEESEEDDYLETLLTQANVDMDVEEIRAFIDSIKVDCFENKAWLEEFLGYEKSGSEYRFNFELDDVLEDLVERAYEADLITKSQKNQLAVKIGCEVEMKIVLAKGYISEIEISVEVNNMEIYAKAKISDVNSTEITDKDKEDTIADYNDVIAKYYSNCAECKVQGKKGSMREVNSKFYCTDCYYDMDHCDICNDFVKEDKLTYIGYDDRCEKCTAAYKAENYVKCKGCSEENDKNRMYEKNSDYYCYDCYYDRRSCDVCNKFVLRDKTEYINYKYQCEDCSAEYKKENYKTCTGCEKSFDKKNMREINEKFYCSSCYYDYDYCDICEEFVHDDTLTRKNYKDYCTTCYDEYKADHTCDLCTDMVVDSDYYCHEHADTGVCGKCGNERYLYYYNVQTKQHLCSYCS